MKLKITFILFLLSLNLKTVAQNSSLFELQSYQKKENDHVNFVSLSDIYSLSEHKDSTAIPSLKGKTESNSKYLKLESKFRKRFLNKTKIAETDKLFIYDYSKDILLSFPVKSLDLVACLNVYGAEWPYNQNDFMIGFEIDDKLASIKDNFSTVFVYAGKESPFSKGEIKKIIWKKITAKDLPVSVAKGKKLNELNQFVKTSKSKPGQFFEFKTNGYQCYLQEYTDSKGKTIQGKYLTVVNEANKKVIFQKLFTESEGVSFAPIDNQWIGKLLNDKTPVVFGFQYFSFGCEEINFLQQSEKPVYINCDNRH
ncbi:hypothetical protein [Flavobacterium sp. H122]|uniref:hypothetical protein n=1 Tax=Flavobacterium sp. H122 TaxID=2529860 RepID=UPI0010A9E6D8|nr:hypothetical protein [Flavobacterium sp. H122]